VFSGKNDTCLLAIKAKIWKKYPFEPLKPAFNITKRQFNILVSKYLYSQSGILNLA